MIKNHPVFANLICKYRNFSAVLTTVGAIAGSLFTAIFLRHDTATKEFEKIKAGQFKEAADELLQAGKMTYTEYYEYAVRDGEC